MQQQQVLNQGDMADAFDVNRSTIFRWQREGMPFRDTSTGNVYHPGVCVHWHLGHKRLEAKGRSLPPFETYVVGWMLAHRDAPEADWLPRLRRVAREHFGLDKAGFERALNRVIVEGWR